MVRISTVNTAKMTATTPVTCTLTVNASRAERSSSAPWPPGRRRLAATAPASESDLPSIPLR
ncbi:hypothetical protein [Streptomyces sp. AcE210]|uniref:hypothetical protein n=1 Tax=Streptomyces sp. AcE210 TaxID=2292703 RepID=UPI0014052C14|nr:hypothetical protein [Streptomyces sp. AcE210]